MKLSSLFAPDSFAAGFVVQSFAVYWFYLRFDVSPGTLSVIFFWANIFAGISRLLAKKPCRLTNCDLHHISLDAKPFPVLV